MNQIIDRTINDFVSRTLIDKNIEESLNHKSSGKLSASMLGSPLQWQVLKLMGVPQKDLDEYVLRKFQRGKDVEKWLVENIPGKVDTQVFVEYRDTVGYIDVLVDTKDYDTNFGIIPQEVKSVANMKYQNIVKSGKADRGHILQACLYALAKGAKHFGVVYIASDDYRILNYIYDTADYKAEVDGIIDRFNAQMDKKEVPVFEPEEVWQKNPNYSSYPLWTNLTQEEVNKKYKEEYGK